MIKGYIKTKFAQSPSRAENMSYGCGSITDGQYKVTIQICNYTAIDIHKGDYVKDVGVVNRNGNSYIYFLCF